MKWLALLLIVAGISFWAWQQGYWTVATQPKPEEAVYQWKDKQGRLHYGDAAPAGVKAKQADLPGLTVVTMPKPSAEKPKVITPSPTRTDDDEDVPRASPSKSIRNPALENMGLTEAP